MGDNWSNWRNFSTFVIISQIFQYSCGSFTGERALWFLIFYLYLTLSFHGMIVIVFEEMNIIEPH
jgi:hypothetical protein